MSDAPCASSRPAVLAAAMASAAASAAAAAGDAAPPLAPPSAAAAAAAAAAGAAAESVFVKAAGPRGRGKQFLKVPTRTCADVADLAVRVAAAFPAWRVGAEDISLFLVSAGFAEAVEDGDESTGIAAKKLFSGASLVHAGVSNGTFLLARLLDPPAAAPSERARARGPQPHFVLVCSAEQGAGWARGTRARSRWGLMDRSLFSAQRFRSFAGTRAAEALDVAVMGRLRLPDLSPYMPAAANVNAYAWGANEKETAASPHLLELLSAWVKFDAVPPIATSFFDVQHVGTFRGMPDAVAPRSAAGVAEELQPVFSSAVVSVGWKTPSAFANAGAVASIGHIQAIAFASKRKSVPVFFTDMVSGFRCWIVIGSGLYYLHPGASLSLCEGVALMRYFLARSEVDGSTATVVDGALRVDILPVASSLLPGDSSRDDSDADISPDLIRDIAVALSRGGGMRLDF